MASNKSLFVAIIVAIILIGLGAFYAIRRGPERENYSSGVLPVLEDKTQIQQEKTIVNNNSTVKNNMHIVTIKTNYGEIQFETFDKDAPKTVNNFKTLVEKGFYDGLTFHRVVKGFVMQGGDPKGNGTGGPGYTFEDELDPNTESYKTGYKKGVVAMANAGPNTNGSQFFIMLADNPLPHNYTIFGKVIKGQDAVDAIGLADTGPNDRPKNPVIMEKVVIK